MNQFRAEFERLWSRTFVQIMVVLLAVLGAITIGLTAANSSRPSAAQIRTGYLHHVFIFSEDANGLLVILMIFAIMIAFLVGASYVGAEITSGAMTNLLLWHPRRVATLGIKLAALLAGVAALSVVSAGLYLGALRLVAAVNGHPGWQEPEAWGALGLTFLRLLVLALLAGALGFALATLGRHTAAALGIAMGYLILWEAGGRLALLISRTVNPDRWMLSTWVFAWGTGGRRGTDYTRSCDSAGENCAWAVDVITAPTALLVLLAVVGAALAAAFASFRRRDLA